MGIVIKQGIQNTFISYFGAVLGFVNKLFFLPKLLHVEQVGLINILGSIALMYAQFSGFGIYHIIVKFFPYYKENKKGEFLSLVLFWITLGFLFITLLFLFFDQYVQQNFLQNSPLLKRYYYWIIPLSAFVFFIEVLDNYSKAILKSVFSSFVKDVFLRLVVMLAIILYWLKWISFDVFIQLFIVSYGISFLMLIVYLVKNSAFEFAIPKIPKKDVLTISRFGFYAMLTGASSIIIANIDSFMLSYYTGLNDVGVYTTMGFLVSAFLIPYRSIFKIASPLVSIHWQKNELNEIQKIYRRFSLTAFFISATLFLFIVSNTSVVFIFLSKVYFDGFYIFIFIGFARLIDVLYGLNTIILMSSKKYWVDLIFLIGLIIFTIITNMIFIPQYGMEGAVIASSISIVLINMIRGWFIWVYFKIKLFNYKLVAQICIFIIVFLICYGVQLSNIWLNMLVKNVLILVGFIFPVLYFSLSPDIKEWLIGKFKKIKKNY